jgi:hypothetical protein
MLLATLCLLGFNLAIFPLKFKLPGIMIFAYSYDNNNNNNDNHLSAYIANC